MKCRRPDVVPDDNIITDLLPLIVAAKEDETDIEHCHIVGVCLESVDLSGIYFRNVIFEDCQFIACEFMRCGFVDVLFKNCDVSNSDCSSSFFDRCEIDSSKWMGVNLTKGSMKEMILSRSNFQYSNWDTATIRELSGIDCDMDSAIFSECKLKSIDWRQMRFSNTDFFKTPLKGIDFTKCEIENLLVSDDHAELRGAIVNTSQAADFARLLGLVVQ